MKKIQIVFVACIAAYSQAAYSQDSATSTPGTPASQVSETSVPEGRGDITMKEQKVSIGPQLGVTSFTDSAGDYTSRGTIGVAADWNAVPAFDDPSLENYFIGLASGVNLTMVGDNNSNFFGGGAETNGPYESSTMLAIPADVKIGYNFSPKGRVSVRGGGNVIYRSDAGAVRFAAEDSIGTETDWSIHPNVGADLEWKIGNKLSLSARPDLTFIPGRNLFMATVGANWMM